jgi:hypothetical protein
VNFIVEALIIFVLTIVGLIIYDRVPPLWKPLVMLWTGMAIVWLQRAVDVVCK